MQFFEQWSQAAAEIAQEILKLYETYIPRGTARSLTIPGPFSNLKCPPPSPALPEVRSAYLNDSYFFSLASPNPSPPLPLFFTALLLILHIKKISNNKPIRINSNEL